MTAFGNMALGLRMRHTPKAETEVRVKEAARLGFEEILDRRHPPGPTNLCRPARCWERL